MWTDLSMYGQFKRDPETWFLVLGVYSGIMGLALAFVPQYRMVLAIMLLLAAVVLWRISREVRQEKYDKGELVNPKTLPPAV